MKITKMEKDLIEELENSEFGNDWGEAAGYIFHEEWNMTSYRGVMASLAKKGLVVWSDTEYINDVRENACTWGYIPQKFMIIKNEKSCLNWELFEMEGC